MNVIGAVYLSVLLISHYNMSSLACPYSTPVQSKHVGISWSCYWKPADFNLVCSDGCPLPSLPAFRQLPASRSSACVYIVHVVSLCHAGGTNTENPTDAHPESGEKKASIKIVGKKVSTQAQVEHLQAECDVVAGWNGASDGGLVLTCCTCGSLPPPHWPC